MDSRFLLCLQNFSKLKFQSKNPFQGIPRAREVIEQREYASQFFICLIISIIIITIINTKRAFH